MSPPAPVIEVASVVSPYQRPLVVHIVYRLDFGGMETVLVDLINRMGNVDYRHAVICLAGYTDFRDRIQSEDVAVYTLNKRAGKDFLCYWRFFKCLRRLSPALVNTYNLPALDVAPIARLAGCAVVHSEHGWLVGKEAVPTKYIRLRKLMRPFVDRFVAVSLDLELWLRDVVEIKVNKLVCIHNGVDPNRFIQDESVRYSTRKSLGLDVDDFVIGTVARLDPVKAQTTLIEAFARLIEGHAETNKIRLLIVGEGSERPRLERLIRARQLDHAVLLTGARTDVPELLAAFDVFALPSENEGVSIAVLEAMASALPVIATRVGGNPEVIIDAETGMLIEVGDVNALADSLSCYWRDIKLARAHGAAGRVRMRSEFSLDAMVEQYRKLYGDVLNGRPPRIDHREVS